MAVDVDVSHAPKYLVFSVKGEWPAAAEQARMHQRLHAAGHFTDQTRALVDLRGAEIPKYPQAEQSVNTAVRNDAWPEKCAFLIGSVVQYGFSRQLQALAPLGTTIEIFSDEAKALQWLLAG